EERLVVGLGDIGRIADDQVEVPLANTGERLLLLGIKPTDEAETLIGGEHGMIGPVLGVKPFEAVANRALRLERVLVEHPEHEGRHIAMGMAESAEQGRDLK